MIASGELGPPRKVVVEYPQGWLTEKLEDEGQKQAAWRSDPAKAGKAGAYGDIGTHAANMAEYVCGRSFVCVISPLRNAFTRQPSASARRVALISSVPQRP